MLKQKLGSKTYFVIPIYGKWIKPKIAKILLVLQLGADTLL